MDTRTPSQKKTAARNHHLAGLYHNAFLTTTNPELGVDIGAHDTNKLVRNGWAMIHVFGTKVVLGRTTTGSKKYDSNCTLRGMNDMRILSSVPRYSKTEVDMSDLMNGASHLSNSYLTRWY